MAVRQPSIRCGRSWILHNSRRRTRSRSSGVSKAVLAMARRTSDQRADGVQVGCIRREADGGEPVVLGLVPFQPGRQMGVTLRPVVTPLIHRGDEPPPKGGSPGGS